MANYSIDKNPEKFSIEVLYCKIINIIYNKPTTKILRSEKLRAFLVRPGTSQGCSAAAAVGAAAKSLQLCLILCDPLDGSPTGSPVPGVPQAKTLEWVAISFSNT